MIISPKKCPLFLQGGRGSSQFWQCQDFGTIWTPIPYLTNNHRQIYHEVQQYLWIVFFNIALVSECTEGSLLSAKKVTEARTSITTNETMTAKKTVIKQKCCITAA